METATAFPPSILRHFTSKREEDFSNDVLGKKLFHEAKALSKRGGSDKKKQIKPFHRIFTSLDGELFRADGEGEEEGEATPQTKYAPVTTDPAEEPNFLAQMMGSTALRRRRTGGGGPQVGKIIKYT